MLLDKRYSSSVPLRTGWLVFGGLLVLAWFFYLERVAYSDLGFYFFRLLLKQAPIIEHGRFVAVLSQILTLIGLKIGLPGWLVIKLYSISFVLLNVVVFALCAYWLRNEHVALVVVFLNILLATRTFYYTPSELLQAMTVLLFCYAGLSRQAPLRWRWSTLALLSLTPVVIIGHPLAIIPFLFVWGYDWLLNQRYTDWAWYSWLATGLASYYWRSASAGADSYDAQHSNIPTLHDLLNAVHVPSFGEFLTLCSSNFAALPLLLVALSIFYLWPSLESTRPAGRLLRLAYIWGFVTGYVLLVCSSYPEQVATDGYFENLLMPLVFFVGVPVALELVPALLAAPSASRWSRLRPTLLGLGAACLLLRVVQVAYVHTQYTTYQNWLSQLVRYTRHFPETKYLMSELNTDPQHLRISSWASAFETLEQTFRQGPDSVRTVFITPDITNFLPYSQQRTLLLNHWEHYPQATLPANYIRLSDKPYRLLNTPLPTDSTALHTYYTVVSQQARLEIVAVPANWQVGQSQLVTVRLTGPANQPLHSGGWQPGGTPVLRLAGSFYSGPSWHVTTPTVAAPLEIDVSTPWMQQVSVMGPSAPGKYDLKISLLAPGHPTGLLNQSISVEIKP